MPSSFDWRGFKAATGPRGARFWLQLAVGALAVLNAVALFLYVAPPGGSRQSLEAESQHLQTALAGARVQSAKLETVAEKVQLGARQTVEFESRYILPKRLAYERILAEIQRMAMTANLVQREGGWREEPIEGTANLSVLTNRANFEGSYESLMRFLYEVDRSPEFLMLDSLSATPQKAGQIVAQIQFQAVIREEESSPAGGQP